MRDGYPDSIHSPEAFAETLPAGFDGVFHWDWISAAVKRATGRNIKPMDIDCFVEINGQFLIFETKNTGMRVPDGQFRALLDLWARGYVTLVLLWGKRTPLKASIFYPSGRQQTISQRVEKIARTGESVDRNWVRDDLEKFVEGWAKFAEKNPCPFAYDGNIDQLDHVE